MGATGREGPMKQWRDWKEDGLLRSPFNLRSFFFVCVVSFGGVIGSGREWDGIEWDAGVEKGDYAKGRGEMRLLFFRAFSWCIWVTVCRIGGFVSEKGWKSEMSEFFGKEQNRDLSVECQSMHNSISAISIASILGISQEQRWTESLDSSHSKSFIRFPHPPSRLWTTEAAKIATEQSKTIEATIQKRS